MKTEMHTGQILHSNFIIRKAFQYDDAPDSNAGSCTGIRNPPQGQLPHQQLQTLTPRN